MKFTFTIPENLDNKLHKIAEDTGLSKAEICRRGLLKELDELKQVS